MMRRLARFGTILLAALMVGTVAVGVRFHPHFSTPVFANYGGCQVNDIGGWVYDNGYASNVASGGVIVYDYFYPDSDPRHVHHIYLDMKMWRATIWFPSDSSYHCVKGFYGSIWSNDGTPANFQVHMDTWICGNRGPAWTTNNVGTGNSGGQILNSGDETWAARKRLYGAGPQDGTSVGAVWYPVVTLPNGENAQLDFFDYGQINSATGFWGCGNQLQNSWTNGSTGSWASQCDGSSLIDAGIGLCGNAYGYMNENSMS